MDIQIEGVDVSGGVIRAGGSVQLYMRFLGRFCEDTTFAALEQAIAGGDAQQAFLHAHTLKGLCAQLGVIALLEPLCALCSCLRVPSENSLHEAARILSALAPLHRRTLERIRHII